MSVHRILAALFLSAALVVAGCTTSGGSPASASGGASSAGAGGVTIGSLSAGNLGTVLTGTNGRTLYTYSGDGANSSMCTGDCATAWPPLTVPAGEQPTAATGVTGKLGTLTRADGTIQVTYDSRPLYYWQGDAKPGDTTGNGVNDFSVATIGGTQGAPTDAGPTKNGY